MAGGPIGGAAPGGRNRKRTVIAAAVVAVVLAFVWTGGLLRFAALIPTAATTEDGGGSTDAIVVLTGGSGRLDAGFSLLARRQAKKLFVSGVYRGVDVDRLLQLSRHNPEDLNCCVNLGYAADSTAGNAVETAAWMAAAGYRSLRLVTANYHMPRALFEFRNAMPDIEIIPHAVFPRDFKIGRWWAWPGSASLIVSEYSKLVLAWAGHRAGRPAIGGSR